MLSPLTPEQLNILHAVALSCRRSIIEMVKQAQSGHPGGSLSSIDYLTLLYTQIISQTGEKVVVSNGHISPAVYSILAECGYIPKEDAINTFRKRGSIYEGHVARLVPGVWFGTGPLGIGVSAATGFALAEKIKAGSETPRKVFGLMGDGEAQEGQVYEALNFAHKYKLDNLILFVDYNRVQLTASLDEIMPLDLPAIFKAAHWNVLEVDGHDFNALWEALDKAYETNGYPTVIIGRTVMGKGVDYMETEGEQEKATWHGSAPKPDQADQALEQLVLTPEQQEHANLFSFQVRWSPEKPTFPEDLSPVAINTGTPILYTTQELTDNRTAYGQALLDLARHNHQIVAITADLRGSVMTKFVASELEHQHFEVGIAEQHMISLAGGLSLDGFIPFTSTFGAFMSSRSKDQARVNDINHTNVKMVATHCGLSVGEDGPTHQAIDDSGSFLGMFHTMVIEPADPNQTDRVIRYVASHYGNFYVRMGRHKYPIITKEDGSPFYGVDYKYEYGKTDTIRSGNDLTVVAIGAMTYEALKAWEILKTELPDLSIELIATTSIKQFDQNLLASLQKTRRVITVEDHNTVSGLGGSIARFLLQNELQVEQFVTIGVEEYQLSGKAEDLYEDAGISAKKIAERIKNLSL